MTIGAIMLMAGAISFTLLHVIRIVPGFNVPGGWKWMIVLSPLLALIASFSMKRGRGVLDSYIDGEATSKWKQFIFAVVFFAIFTGSLLIYGLTGGTNVFAAVALLGGSLSGYIMMIVASSPQRDDTGFMWSMNVQIGLMVLCGALLTIALLFHAALEKANQKRFANPQNAVQLNKK